MQIPTLPDRIDPWQLAAENGRLDGELRLAALPRLAALLERAEGTVSVALAARVDEQGLRFVEGSLQTEVGLICQRCLGPLRLPLQVAVSLALIRAESEFARLPSQCEPLLAAGADLGDELQALADAYERLLAHHEFTGRSGTMFGYEGLGCIYWHMVAKLLLAVQERVFEAHDAGAPELQPLVAHYRRVRDGLGYRKSAADWGAFPADPYSHTPGEGGAQQPGMTGQVKEEILTRWGELGLRMRQGRVHFDPVLLDAAELPEGGELRFTWASVPYRYRRGTATRLRVRDASGWRDCPERCFDPQGVLAVEADVFLTAA